MTESGAFPVTLRTLEPGERARAVRVIAHAMRDNPLHLAAFGAESEPRSRAVERLFEALLANSPLPPLGALVDGRIVGVLAVAPPGACRMPPLRLLRVFAALARVGPRGVARRLEWLRALASRDPEEPHWHVGPVVVAPDWQARGVGGRMLARLCARLDREEETAFLETDRPENVRLYRRFGFEPVSEATVIGVRCWFMERSPGRPLET